VVVTQSRPRGTSRRRCPPDRGLHALGIVGEAQTAAAVLGHNFPDSRWYKDAYNLVRSCGVEPTANKDSWITRAFKKVGFG